MLLALYVLLHFFTLALVETIVLPFGKKKFEIDTITKEAPYLVASVKEVYEDKPDSSDKEFKAIIDSIKELSLEIIKESPNIPSEASFAIKNIESNSFLINFISVLFVNTLPFFF
mgnify:CR=1 FL=1